MEGGDLSLPNCPVKLEINEYDQSNGYGEPLAKRPNTTSNVQAAAPTSALNSAGRNQCKLILSYSFLEGSVVDPHI